MTVHDKTLTSPDRRSVAMTDDGTILLLDGDHIALRLGGSQSFGATSAIRYFGHVDWITEKLRKVLAASADRLAPHDETIFVVHGGMILQETDRARYADDAKKWSDDYWSQYED